MLMLWSWSEGWGWAWDVGVLTLVRMLTLVVMLVCVVEGKIAWVMEVLDGGCVTGSLEFVESPGKTSQTVSHSFSISAVMCFWSASKGEVVNVVEVFTDEYVEVWEYLRLDLY